MINVSAQVPLSRSADQWRDKALVKTARKLFTSQHIHNLRSINGQGSHTNDNAHRLLEQLTLQGYAYVESAIDRAYLNSFKALFKRDSNCQSEMHPLDAESLKKIWKHIISVSGLIEACKSYLEPSETILHEACTFYVRDQVKSDKSNTSSYWHRDSIGARLKLFICIDQFEAGLGPSTELVPYPILDPIPKRWEMARALPEGSAREEELRNVDAWVKDLGPVRLTQVPGSLLIIDTNCIHRGKYSYAVDGGPIYDRHLIQLSLIGSRELAFYQRIHGICYSYPPNLYQNWPDLSHGVVLSKKPFTEA